MSAAAPELEGMGPRQDASRFNPSSLGWLMPSAALVGVLFLFPIGYAFYLAFTNLELIGPNAQNY